MTIFIPHSSYLFLLKIVQSDDQSISRFHWDNENFAYSITLFVRDNVGRVHR